ncbi:DUF4838 domain-containing protein [Dyadobacter luteus]|uniref:DUF4838 domain-containing protein n=1 Tax=Dyadobacter luteus TaxID=2259619 RepID=UPI00131419BB|nr:DUF4838 domain-containing protein [Dyadobacter luteus]
MSNQKTSYQIVIPKKVNSLELQASRELQTYIHKATGVKLEIVQNGSPKKNKIYIGKKLGSHKGYWLSVSGDGYSIDIINNDVFLNGGNGKGILYAAYGFLEKVMGVEQLDMHEWYIPKNSTIKFTEKISAVYNPAFKQRDIYNDLSYSDNYTDWNMLTHFFKEPNEWGMFGHTFFKLIPPKAYLASHPEYFSLVSGKRLPGQLCLSNSDVAKTLIDTLRILVNQKPNKLFWMVGQEDTGSFCTCDKCKDGYQKWGGHSGMLMKFINNVAKEFPTKIIATFAYHETLSPPSLKNVKPLPNVLICYAPIEAYREKSFDKLSNTNYFLYLKKWKSITKHLMVYDYTENFIDFLRPYPTIFTFKPNLLLFKEIGVDYVYMESFIKIVGDLKELKSYVLSKLLWNPQLDDNALITTFCDRYYKEASPYLQQYIFTVQAAVREEKDRLRSWGGTTGYLKPAHLSNYDRILEQASSAAGSDSVVLGRINRVRMNVDFNLLNLPSDTTQNVSPSQRNVLGRDQKYVDRKARFIKTVKDEKILDFVKGGKWILANEFIKSLK